MNSRTDRFPGGLVRLSGRNGSRLQGGCVRRRRNEFPAVHSRSNVFQLLSMSGSSGLFLRGVPNLCGKSRIGKRLVRFVIEGGDENTAHHREQSSGNSPHGLLAADLGILEGTA